MDHRRPLNIDKILTSQPLDTFREQSVPFWVSMYFPAATSKNKIRPTPVPIVKISP